MKDQVIDESSPGKFADPKTTANGQARAHVSLIEPRTLWFNTGTVCNITCENCYIESSPTNDALQYITRAEVEDFLDQITSRGWPVTEIAFTGGEPFMNPEMIAMARAALERGYECLILTNAMRPMMRPSVKSGLAALVKEFGRKLTLRISVDHHCADFHDQERGTGSFDKTIEGMEWLRDQGISMAIAGRTMWHEDEAKSRAGYAALFKRHGFEIDANNPAQTVLFPEMDATVDVPEITTACWTILDKSPQSVMCSSSRMVVRRKGSNSASVLACTLLAYEPEFELGTTLEQAERDVSLNHPHCAKFCVLGGASCSA